MIDPLVRPATVADAAELSRLEDEARATLVDQRGGARWLEEHPRRGPSWDGLGATGAGEDVFLATVDDVPVGYLVQRRDGSVVRVVDVYVTPGARELGFGDALLAAGLAQARADGATWFEGEALPGDRDTKNLYERAGITARLITVSTRISDA